MTLLLQQEVLGIPLAWLAAASLTVFFGTLLLVPLVIVRMPSDYFLAKEPPPDSFRRRHPVLSLVARMAKNVAGVGLVAIGLALLVLPGQGLLTILLGLVLVDFPGKRRLELRIVRRPRVHGAIDRMRRWFDRPALELPEA